MFVQVPDGFVRTIGSFAVDHDVPLPLETGGRLDAIAPDAITAEGIIAGMLRVLAARPDGEHAEYYRGFVEAIRPNLFPEFMEAGILKARNGQYDIAEDIFNAMAGLDPDSPVPQYNLAILYESRADASSSDPAQAELWDDKAFATYKRLLSLETPFPDAFFGAAHFYLKRKNFERARELFESYLKMGDDEHKKRNATENIAILDKQGLLDIAFKEAYDFIRMGQEERGVKRALEFLEGHPDTWNAWFLVGWGYRRLERWDEAIDAFRKAEALEKGEVDVYNELSICLMERGLYADSRKALESAYRLEPENVKIISNMGIVASKMGKTEEAAAFFRIALDLDPDDEVASCCLAELEGDGLVD